MRSLISYYFQEGTKALRGKREISILNPFITFGELASLNAHERTIDKLNKLDYSSTQSKENMEIMKRFNKMRDIKIETINWFIPTFKHAFGGIHTILRFANYFHTKKGIKNSLIIYGDPQTTSLEIKERISKLFPDLSLAETIILKDDNVDTLPYADISIATRWDSAYLVLKFNKTKGKFYFIQDYEPLFYPASTEYALAEATYRFGFNGIINTPGLYEIYTENYNGIAEYFIPSVDQNVFYPAQPKVSKPSAENPFTIFFYARPEAPRNAFELGITALSRMKQKYGELVKIYAAGAQWNPNDYGVEKQITVLGTLPYQETATLYRKCDLGIVFMFTKHPSYLPFELMACGCPVLTNYNPSTLWMLKDGENCVLAEPTPAIVFEKIETLMNDPNLRTRIISNGLELIHQTNWETEIEKIYKFICNCF